MNVGTFPTNLDKKTYRNAETLEYALCDSCDIRSEIYVLCYFTNPLLHSWNEEMCYFTNPPIHSLHEEILNTVCTVKIKYPRSNHVPLVMTRYNHQ